ncbi:MAG: SpoIIE family protein phosphatase [Spirochaeta sp.]
MDDKQVTDILHKDYAITQVGSIAQFVSPLSTLSTLDEAKALFMEDERLAAVPIENEDGGVFGVVTRDQVMGQASSLLGSLTSTSLQKKMSTDVIRIQARENVDRIISDIFDKYENQRAGVLLVYKNSRDFLGVVSFQNLVRHSAMLRGYALDRARQIQEFLITSGTYQNPPFQAELLLKMAHEVGGDFFQLIKLSETRYLCAGFDVSGKNISASLSTSIIASCLATLQYTKRLGSMSPAQIADILHSLVDTMTPIGVFVAAGMVFIDLERKELIIGNMGFSTIYVQQYGGDSLKWKRVPSKMAPFGISSDPDAEFRFARVGMPEGASIFMFSDGLTDIRNEDGVMYEDERIEAFLAEHGAKPAREFIQLLEDEVVRYIGKAPQADDVTAIMINIPQE